MSILYTSFFQVTCIYIAIYILNLLIDIFDENVYKTSTAHTRKLSELEDIATQQNIELKDIIIDEDKKRRWYTLHALINTYITVVVIPDVIFTILDPLEATKPDYNTMALSASIALHLYHIMTSMKNMDFIEWVHHLVSSLFVGLVAMFYLRGKLVNYILFFICGLPGGIDYYLLALNKYAIVDRETEKRINVDLNMWIRVPGILYACFVAWICQIYTKHAYNPFICILIIFLNLYNSLYFASRVAQNYGFYMGKKHKINEAVDKENSHTK